MTPAKYDFCVVRGSSATSREYSPLVARFSREGVPIIFTAAQLAVFSGAPTESKGALLFRANMGNAAGDLKITDAATSELSWLATMEQTRKLMPGENYYEIQLTVDGAEVVLLLGTMSGIGGLNEDAGAVAQAAKEKPAAS